MFIGKGLSQIIAEPSVVLAFFDHSIHHNCLSDNYGEFLHPSTWEVEEAEGSVVKIILSYMESYRPA